MSEDCHEPMGRCSTSSGFAKPKNSHTVGITAAGTVTAQGVMKALRLQDTYDVKIIAFDPDIYVVGRYLADVFERVPYAYHPTYVNYMVELCDKHGIDLLIPIFDEEIIALSSHVDKFDCHVVVSDPKAIEYDGLPVDHYGKYSTGKIALKEKWRERV